MHWDGPNTFHVSLTHPIKCSSDDPSVYSLSNQHHTQQAKKFQSQQFTDLCTIPLSFSVKPFHQTHFISAAIDRLLYCHQY